MLKKIRNCEASDFFLEANGNFVWLIAQSYESRGIEVVKNITTNNEIIFFDLNRLETTQIDSNYESVCQKNPNCSIFKFKDFNNEGIRDQELYELLSRITDKSPLAIDISCMSRRLMASLVSCIYRLAESKVFKLRIAYSIAKFKKPSDHMDNSAIGSVHSMFNGLTVNPFWPRSGIVGLGYEIGKALGAMEYLQLNAEYLWLPISPDEQYSMAVSKHNSELLSEKARRIEYDVCDPHSTLLDILSLINDLKKKNSPVLLPFGPKIFFFLCLLTSMEHPEAAIWDVTAVNNRENINDVADVSSSKTIGFEFEIHNLKPTQ
jgi:hypothetical protein